MKKALCYMRKQLIMIGKKEITEFKKSSLWNHMGTGYLHSANTILHKLLTVSRKGGVNLTVHESSYCYHPNSGVNFPSPLGNQMFCHLMWCNKKYTTSQRMTANKLCFAWIHHAFGSNCQCVETTGVIRLNWERLWRNNQTNLEGWIFFSG